MKAVQLVLVETRGLEALGVCQARGWQPSVAAFVFAILM